MSLDVTNISQVSTSPLFPSHPLQHLSAGLRVHHLDSVFSSGRVFIYRQTLALTPSISLIIRAGRHRLKVTRLLARV